MSAKEQAAERVVIAPPQAERRLHITIQFNETRVDPYYWLRGWKDDWQQVLNDPSILAPEIRDHLVAENAYTAQYVSQFENLAQQIGDELVGRLDPNASTIPLKYKEWEYWTAYTNGSDYPAFKRRHLQSGVEQTYYDIQTESAGHDFFDVSGVSRSPDQKMIAYGVDVDGSEYYTIRFRNIETGQENSESIARTSGEVFWSKNSDRVYYVECDDHHRPRFVKSHVLGEDPEKDVVVYEEDDETLYMGIGTSDSRDYLFITSSGADTSEVRFLNLDEPFGAEPTLIRAKEAGVQYHANHHGNDFYILTNDEGATEYKIMRTPVDKFTKENWVEVVPCDPDIFIEGVEFLQDYMIRQERTNALPRIVVSDFKGNEYIVDFPDQAYDVSVQTGLEFDDDVVRLHYQTPANPGVIYELDLKTGAKTVLKEKQLPNGHDPSEYIVERKFIEARDGAQVPVTITRHKSTKLDGSAPLFQYGYGSYGMSMDPYFSSRAISMVDRGVIYAVAHVRGGSEMGEKWYLNGKKEHKMNTFYDFIDVTEALTDQGYGKKGEVCMEGGSAGGLLMGAVVNLRPDLYTGVIADVPFVDVLTTISDASLPLTPGEWEEWGNPITNKGAYDLIKSYSPYDAIQKGVEYPPIYACCGVADHRVTYWEPAKWIQRLRDEAQGGPFMLKTELGSGHFGSSARSESMRQVAPQCAFAIHRFESHGYDMHMRVDYDGGDVDSAPDLKNNTDDAPRADI